MRILVNSHHEALTVRWATNAIRFSVVFHDCRNFALSLRQIEFFGDFLFLKMKYCVWLMKLPSVDEWWLTERLYFFLFSLILQLDESSKERMRKVSKIQLFLDFVVFDESRLFQAKPYSSENGARNSTSFIWCWIQWKSGFKLKKSWTQIEKTATQTSKEKTEYFASCVSVTEKNDRNAFFEHARAIYNFTQGIKKHWL